MNIFSLDKERLNYFEKLSEANQLLVNVTTKTEAGQRDAVRAFMGRIGKLFLEYFQYDLEEARNLGASQKEILKEAEQFFWGYLARAENTLTDFEGGNDWEKACVERTNIEAFNEMFKGVIDPLDTEEIEEYMDKTNKRHKCVESDHIPKNVPKSHWWWFV